MNNCLLHDMNNPNQYYREIALFVAYALAWINGNQSIIFFLLLLGFHFVQHLIIWSVDPCAIIKWQTNTCNLFICIELCKGHILENFFTSVSAFVFMINDEICFVTLIRLYKKLQLTIVAFRQIQCLFSTRIF
jgi:hypothetical protein